MIGLLAAFFSSFIVTLLIIRFEHLHSHLSGDSDLSGPQKFHKTSVPRIGGVAIVIGILCAILLKTKSTPNSNLELLLLISCIPVFGIGLCEDLTKKISVRMRLLLTALAALLFTVLLNARIMSLHIPVIDYLLTIPTIGIMLTIFAITGLANAYNIIDGFNGLSSMVAIITLMALGYLGFSLSDLLIVYLSFSMAAAILGFFVWNYPKGLIFLGDGGAYLIGFWVASVSVLLTERHSNISPWFALLVNAYPILETLFTIYRRRIHQGRSPGQPDGTHFHSLIYRRVLNTSTNTDWFTSNARTAPYLWVLSTLAIVPAVLWWQSTPILALSFLLFTASYIWLYSSIVRFKIPKWMRAL